MARIQRYEHNLYQDVYEYMFDLRRKGYSYTKIGLALNRDHTTVMYHCKKAGVEPEAPLKTERPPTLDVKKRDPKLKKKYKAFKLVADKYDYVYKEKINEGKNYKEYLREQELRRWGF